MKILNLYAGIGGNRKLWPDEHEVIAVEMNPDIAKIYKDFFPNDNVIVGDAHEYLLENFQNFDFIWSSPPCQSHSQIRYNLQVKLRGHTKPIYPDMTLYQEILFLQHNSKGLWCVENVRPYYDTLIKPTAILHRHLFWSNFGILDRKFTNSKLRSAQIKELQRYHGFDLEQYKIKNKRQVLRNCLYPELGKHVFLGAMDGDS